MKYIINFKKDVKVERFAASSKGGQNANKTEVNVRMTHIPTGIKSQATSERSLDQNFRAALTVLILRIMRYFEDQKEKAPPKKEPTFGNQDRSYYLNNGNVQRVVDHRTGAESSDQKIMDGKIDIFIEASLRGELK